uniref:Putative peptidase family m13 includes neprilysin n=1 Tax=Ixodes ricinus TaxID=34613 RepID=A0A0K8RKB1_IXORI
MKWPRKSMTFLSNMTEIASQAESLNKTIAMAYQLCMKEDSSHPAEEIKRLRDTLKRFGILEWPMMTGSNKTINWQEIYRKIRIEADMSFIFSVNLNPNLTNTSVRAIDIDVSGFVPTLDQIYNAQNKNDSAVEAYEDFIKQTVILFSEKKAINVTTKIAQDIFEFEVNLTKEFYKSLEFEEPDFPENTSLLEDYYNYRDEFSSTMESELGYGGNPGRNAFASRFHALAKLQARSEESASPPEKGPEPSTKLKDIDGKLKSLLTDIFKDASVNLSGRRGGECIQSRIP